MERWNGGMDFFLIHFCPLTIILWLSFQFACFYFRQSCSDCVFLCCCLLFFYFSIGNKSRHKNLSETFRHVFIQVLFWYSLLKEKSVFQNTAIEWDV